MTHRTLHEALGADPLFFAPVVPSARSPAHRIAERVDEVVRAIERLDRVDAIFVPELIEENHEGRPRYRTSDPGEFALHVTARTGHSAVVAKVVAHFEGDAAIDDWARACVRAGIVNTVLVGGSSRFVPYPGPAVVEADRRVAPVFRAAGGLVGNVAIPQRRGEAERMLMKTRAGASFLTTQLLFEADATARTVAGYGQLCRESGVAPATLVASFAPVGDEDDLDFARWLGAFVPDEVERALLEDDQGFSRRSVDLALTVWKSIVRATSGSGVPLGVNVEQVSARHLETARELIRRFTEILPPVRVAPSVEEAAR